MQTLAIVLGSLTGLRLVAPDLPPQVTIVTAVAMQITYAILARVFASQRNRAQLAWMILGFATGVLAVFALLLLGDRKTGSPT